ncbi:MAG: hypothetical protein EG824_07180 [Deltaproteobacteria bacterium]|nr:hypothetical protein [Deltaproteobacteria bacterium]
MGKVFAALAASAVLAFSGIVFAAEPFPEQEATVTTTVTDPEGKVLQQDVVSDTTKGADTTSQVKQLEKGAAEEMKAQDTKAEEKAAAPAKKKTAKKKAKKPAKKTKPAPAAPAAPETK